MVWLVPVTEAGCDASLTPPLDTVTWYSVARAAGAQDSATERSVAEPARPVGAGGAAGNGGGLYRPVMLPDELPAASNATQLISVVGAARPIAIGPVYSFAVADGRSPAMRAGEPSVVKKMSAVGSSLVSFTDVASTAVPSAAGAGSTVTLGASMSPGSVGAELASGKASLIRGPASERTSIS